MHSSGATVRGRDGLGTYGGDLATKSEKLLLTESTNPSTLKRIGQRGATNPNAPSGKRLLSPAVAPMGTCRPLVARPGFLSRHSAVSEISCHTPLCTHIRESRTDCPTYFAIDALCPAPSPRKHLCAITHQTAMPARSPVLSQASFPSMSRFMADPRGD